MEEHEKPDSSRGPGFGFSLLYFVLHLATIYLVAQYVVMAVEGQFHNAILPMLGVPSREGVLESAFNLLPFFSVLCGLLFGLMAATYNHRAAQFVWIVPTTVLAFKFITFPSSLFANHFALAFHHYFAGGFLIPESHNYRELFMNYGPESERGMDQLRFTAPVYVSVAYGLASWTGSRLGIRLPLLGAPKPPDILPSNDAQPS